MIHSRGATTIRPARRGLCRLSRKADAALRREPPCGNGHGPERTSGASRAFVRRLEGVIASVRSRRSQPWRRSLSAGWPRELFLSLPVAKIVA